MTAWPELRGEMERWFESMFREPFERVGRSVGLVPWAPTLDIAESDREVTVRAEVPGVSPEDLDIQVSGNQLILSGEKREQVETREEGYYHSERRFGSFRRAIPLPAGVDADQVTADYEQGVLTIRLPKTEVSKPKQIQIRSSQSAGQATGEQPQSQGGPASGDGNRTP